MKPNYKLKSSHSVWSPALLVIAGLAGMAASYAGVRILASGTLPAPQTSRLQSAVTLETASPSIGYGQSLSLIAVVPAVCGSNGKISFYDGGVINANIIAVQPIRGTSSILNTASLSPGSHAIRAIYSGNAICAASSSVIVPLAITKPVGVARVTGTSLASSRSSVAAGTPLNLIASVSGACGPTGLVDFYDGSQAVANLIGTSNYSNGRAIIAPTLKPGIHKIVATYKGDNTCDKSSSQPFSQSVTP